MHLALDLGMSAKAEAKDCEIIGLSADATPTFRIAPGKGVTFSLVPHGGSALITDAEGTEYPLDNLTLTPKDTRGISNVTVRDEISFNVKAGTAFLIINRPSA